MDRTKPPPFFEPRYKDACSFVDSQLYIVDNDGGPCSLTIDTAWDWYDRITLPARVALLRELAAETRANGNEVLAMQLDGRAAALEAKG